MDAKPKTILLVEDNKADIRLVQEALKNSSITYQMVTVRDGVAAMAYLHQEGEYADALRPDLVILDLNLPKKDGREVLAEIKTNPQYKRIPVIVLTTSKNEDDIHQSYDLNANCFITKSRNLSQLFTIVQRIEEFWLSTVTLPPQ
ncbi:MAG: response regulator [Waterburya sp.]|jgi:chemotaxis family two-component system response regulator Rcp1